MNAQKTVTVHSLHDPGNQEASGGGPGPQKCSPTSLPRAPGTQSGSRGRQHDVCERDVCELLVQTGKRTAGTAQRGHQGWAQLSPIQPSTVAGRGKAGLLAPGAPRVVGFPSPRSWGHVQLPGSLGPRAVSPAGWAPPKQGSLLGLSLHAWRLWLIRCLCPCSGDRVPAQTLTLQLTGRLHPGLGKAASRVSGHDGAEK